MGIVFRQSIKTSVVNFSGIALGALITIITAKLFPADLFGGSRNLLNQGASIHLFLLVGAGSVLHTYIQRFAVNDPKRPVIVTIYLLIPIITTLLFCIPYFFLKDYVISRYQPKDRVFMSTFYAWLPVLGFLWSYMSMLEVYLTAQLKVALSNFMREIVLRIVNLGLILLFFLNVITFNQFIQGTILAFVVPVAALFYFSFKTEGFQISLRWRILSRAEYYDTAKFAWYHMLTGISILLMGTIDALMLAPLSGNGFNDVAVFGIAQLLMSIMLAPYKAMGAAAFPRLNQEFLGGDKGRLNELFKRAGLNMLLTSTFMWVIVVANLHNAQKLFSHDYSRLGIVFVILSIGRMVDIATGLNTELISITNHYKFNFRSSAGLIVFIAIFDYLVIPKYQLLGAAWVSTGSLALYNLIKMIFLYKKVGLHPFSKEMWRILLIGSVSFLGVYFLPHLSSPFIDAFYRSAVAVILFAGMVLWLKPSADMHGFMMQLQKRKKAE